ncbi:LysE family translocator [Vibrio sonorensis]|uniref:LysE family translocator n=1 Tax=Vibrio sonorensis TaxID=1004316 RepID=UPI0008DAB274|nr:LysE family translocator [Vibrio sonorensis]
MSLLVLWLGVMFPLVFSPGPANIVFAASGAKVGVRKTLPLMAGIDLLFIIKSILIGFGLGEVIARFPLILPSLQLVGALYLIYLAYGFLQSGKSGTKNKTSTLGFKDGLIIQFLNGKGWVMVILMFSLFTESAIEAFGSIGIWVLVVWLAALNISMHLLWIRAGALLSNWLNRGSAKRQGSIYAASLLAVALWLIADNPYWMMG